MVGSYYSHAYVFYSRLNKNTKKEKEEKEKKKQFCSKVDLSYNIHDYTHTRYDSL